MRRLRLVLIVSVLLVAHAFLSTREGPPEWCYERAHWNGHSWQYSGFVCTEEGK